MHIVDTYYLQVRSPTRVSYIAKGGLEKIQLVSEDTTNEFNFLFLDDITDWTQICKENSLIFKGKSLIFFDRFSTLETHNNKTDVYNEINLLLKDDIVYFFRHKEEKNVFMLVNQENVNKILGE